MGAGGIGGGWTGGVLVSYWWRIVWMMDVGRGVEWSGGWGGRWEDYRIGVQVGG